MIVSLDLVDGGLELVFTLKITHIKLTHVLPFHPSYKWYFLAYLVLAKYPSFYLSYVNGHFHTHLYKENDLLSWFNMK